MAMAARMGVIFVGLSSILSVGESGEARVTLIKERYAVLAKPGLDGMIFVVPSSLLGQQPFGYPPMPSLLRRNDVVTFKANPQQPRNGVKWQAIDNSVRLRHSAKDIEYMDTGIIGHVDKNAKQYGYIQAPGGTVWFNMNATKASRFHPSEFQVGERVRFLALKQDNSQCPYRAVSVDLYSPLPHPLSSEANDDEEWYSGHSWVWDPPGQDNNVQLPPTLLAHSPPQHNSSQSPILTPPTDHASASSSPFI